MARSANVNISGVWRTVSSVRVNVAGTWRTVGSAYVKVGANWIQWWPAGGGGTLPAGVYELSATSTSIGTSTTAWALFNTTQFQGRVTQVRCIISWLNSTSYAFTIADRAAGAASISRDKLSEYQGRTIYHGTAAGSLASFNSGASTGFTLVKPSGVGWSTEISSVRMEVTIS